MPPSRVFIFFVLFVGVLAVSTAAPLIRLALSTANQSGLGFSLVLAATRLSVAAIAILPAWKGLQVRTNKSAIGYAIAAGICLALHFSCWILSLSYTSITAATVLVTTNPIWIALLSWIVGKERPSNLTMIGILIACGGSSLVALGGGEDITKTSHPLLGNGLALVGAIVVSCYLLLGRAAQARGLSIQHYTAIAYSTAAVIVLPLPLLIRASYNGYPPIAYGCMILLALGPQLIGHTSLNWAVKWIAPTTVSLVILAEPIVASGLGYLFFREVPTLMLLLGAITLLLGVAIALRGIQKQSSKDS